MKSKPNLFARVSPALAVITLAAMTQAAHAAALTWDSDTGTSGAQDGSGTWTTGLGGWWNGTTNVNWAATDTAIFGAGTDAGSKTITLGGAITAAVGNSTTGGIHFANSGYTLSAASAQAITFANADAYLTVAAGKSATIGANVTVQSFSGRTMNISGGGTLYIQDGGTVRNPAAGNNLFNIVGGTTVNVGTNGTLLATNNQLVIGTGAAGNGTLVVDGGTVTVGTSGSTTSSSAQNIVLTNSSSGSTSGILTINSGSVTNNSVGRASGGESGLRLGTTNSGGTPTATVNLNGGVLTVARVYENASSSVDSTFNFNGGTLKVTTGAGNAANFLSGLNNAYIKEGSGLGGAIIDTNNVATTIAQVLQHGGVAATDGGLVKKGAGTLTLTGDNSYTGKTDVQVGTLTLGRVGGTILDTAALEVSGGILNVANAEAVGAVTLTSGTISGAAALTGTSYTLKSGTVSSELAGSGIVLTKNTSGTVTLGGTNTYTGATNIDAGTLDITGTGAINNSSGITINGTNAKFKASGSIAVSPVVTLTQGTLTGSGTVNTVNVGAGTGGIITNNDGVGGNDLAIGTLALAGGATINLFSNSTSAPLTISSFTNNSALNAVTLTANNTGGWTTGGTYDIITYGGGAIGGSGGYNFNKTINNLSARQVGTWSDTGSAITLGISGDTVTWTGTANGNWTTTAVGSPFNWKTTGGGAGTEFLVTDDVIFDDTGSTTAIEILDANVSPASVTFNNSTQNYTISSTGGFGIASGSVTKNGSGTVNLTTTNTNSGNTTINAGTLQVSGGSVIANNGLVSISNSVGATFRVSVSETIGALSGGGGTGGSVTIDAGQTLTLSSGTQTYAGSISGDGALTSSGAIQTLNGTLSHGGGISLTTGSLSLGGNNTYTGQTTVSAGAGVIVTANNALGATGAGNETVLSGAGGANSGAIGLSGGITYGAGEKIIGAGLSNTAANGAFTSVQRGIVQSISGDNTFAGDIEISSTGITRFGTQDGADLTLSGSITRGTGITGVTVLFRPNLSGDWVTVSGSGSNWDNETLIFTGATSGAAGVRLGADDALSTVATLRAGGNTTGSGTTLDLNGFDQTVGGLFNSNGTLHITNNTAATNSILTLNTAADWSSDSVTNKTTIEDGVGQVSLVKSGTFKQTLAGTHTYTGNTTIKAGTLALTSAATIDNSAEIIVGDTGSSGAVLDVTAKSAFAIGSGQTLSGIGTVNIGAGKTVTIDGTHAPGNSAGTQSITGNLSYSSGSIFEWDLASGTLGTRGTDYDGVDVTGTLGGSGAVFKVVLGTGSFSDTFWNTTREWTGIFTASNGFDMSSIFGSIQWWEGSTNVTGDLVTPPGHFTFTNSGTTLTWTAVPEPTSALAGLLITAGLLRRRRANSR